MLLSSQGRLEEAETLLRQARAVRPRDASLAFNLGLLLAERGKPGEAEQALRSALEADPHLAAAAYNLAVMVGERRPREAVGLARKAVEVEPGTARYGWTLGYFQARSGDLRGAAETLERLVLAHPEYADGWQLLAEVYTREGRTAEADALLRRRPPGP
jgi:Flp pilus assembly protein TadD